jgi:monofunctional biosynthetic peptidoglycan transglycosylase
MHDNRVGTTFFNLLKGLRKLSFSQAIAILKNLLAYFTFTFFLVTISGVIFHGVFRPVATPLMIKRTIEQAMDTKPVQYKYNWQPLEEISPHLVLAVVASEDNNFLTHFGIDMEALQKAREENKWRKRPRGASTITQQTAKNLFLLPHRSYIRKGLELYFSFLMELFWSKRRIMEMYLNIIEMGDGIYGAGAASKHYYGKPAKNLTRSRAAMIAAILPNPRVRDPRRPSPYMYKRQKWILWNMRNIEKVDL